MFQIHKIGIVFCSLLLSCNLYAAQIQYSLTNINNNVWQYDYTVNNTTLASDIEQFSIVFDIDQYTNLSTSLTPAGWDALVLQPDADIPDDGIYDALALGSGIGLGEILGGFTVEFEYLGAGIPGAQAFTIVDRNTFATLESGTTVVPLPGALWLFMSGLLFGGFFVRSSKQHADRAVKEPLV